MTLTEFLLARIAEDEAAAEAATAGPWWYDPTKVNSVDRGEAVFAGKRGIRATTIASTGPADDLASMADAAHIARHDPARVLAECEAKRRIVERHSGTNWGAAPGDPYPMMCDECQDALWPCPTLRLLSLPYADHPDYDEEWRP